jgi:hypothetical protein
MSNAIKCAVRSVPTASRTVGSRNITHRIRFTEPCHDVSMNAGGGNVEIVRSRAGLLV